MKNNELRNDYEAETRCERAYDEAKRNNDENGMNAAREAYQTWEKVIGAKDQTYINLYRLYRDAQKRGNELIDLSDVVWDNQVEPLIASFREYGIERFTFSSGWSSAVETAWLFTELGCKLEGLVEINGQTKAFMSDELKKVHGYLFSVN